MNDENRNIFHFYYKGLTKNEKMQIANIRHDYACKERVIKDSGKEGKKYINKKLIKREKND